MEAAHDYSDWRRHGIVGVIRHVRIADMQNDIELTRKILAAVRDKDHLRPAPVQISDYEPVLVMRHVKRLFDDGMIEGTVQGGLGTKAPFVFVTDMTTAGHTFLAALEDDTIWNSLKETLSLSKLATLSIKQIAAIANELAVKQARDLLGL